MTKQKKETKEQPQKPQTTKEKISQLEKLADRLERMRMGDYVTTLNKTSRLIWLNLVSGMARGVGFFLGATLVVAIIIKIVSTLVSLNVPYLSDMMKEAQTILENRYAAPQK